MQINNDLSPELSAIEDKLNIARELVNNKKYGYFPNNAKAAREEFLNILTQISECHDVLVKKITDDISDEFVPTGSVFKLGLGNYASGINGLIMLSHLIERRSKS